MEMIKDVILDTGLDCLKMLPYLFVAFILIEALEHYSGEFTEKVLAKVGKAGPIFGAVAGCIPQCGFSVMAANLYAGGIISVGTLLSVFIATSDEAILIMLGNPDAVQEVGILLVAKVVIAIVAGYVIDIFFQKKISIPKESGNLCDECGCHEEESGVLNLCIEIFGIEQLSTFLLGDTIFQPFIAAVIGLIPNCAASVILTQLYLNGAISFASVIAGLCTGAGIGLVVLFKINREKKENLKIVGVLYIISVIAGVILEIFA